ASMMERVDAPSAAAPIEQTRNDAPAPAAIAEQPVQQPVAAADSAVAVPAAGAPAAGGPSVLQFVLAFIAFVGLVACPIFYLAGVRLRRSDVLSKAQHLNALPAEVPVEPAQPTFQ